MNILTSDIVLYIRADGSDTNDGSADTAAGAFRTLQRAYDFAANSIFLAGFKLVFQIGVGSFTGVDTNRGILGSGNPDDVVFRGSGPTTIVSPSATSVMGCSFGVGTVGTIYGAAGSAIFSVESLKIYAPGAYGILACGGGCAIHYKDIDFGACATHVTAAHNSWIQQTGPCVISGSAPIHAAANTLGVLALHYQQLTFQNSPNFSLGFVYANGGSRIYCWPLTLINASTVTGKKFDVMLGSVLDAGGNVNNLPGTIAGTVESSGIYA